MCVCGVGVGGGGAFRWRTVSGLRGRIIGELDRERQRFRERDRERERDSHRQYPEARRISHVNRSEFSITDPG